MPGKRVHTACQITRAFPQTIFQCSQTKILKKYNKHNNSHMILSFLAFLLAIYYLIKTMIRKFCRPNFENKTVWITGASSGLGQHLAYQFSRKNVGRLILSARRGEQLERVRNACTDPSKVVVLKMDLIQYDSVRKITEQTIRDLEADGRKLDIVVENAGISMNSDFVNFDFENHLKIIDLNVHGVFNHIKSFLPHMITQHSGQVVVISSDLGKFDKANRSSYCASKFSLNSMMDSFRSESYEHGIVVTSILPGYMHTKITANALQSGKGQQTHEDNPSIVLAGSPVAFAQEAIKAIYLKEPELAIAKEWIMTPIRVMVRGVCPDIGFLWSRFANRTVIKKNRDNYYRSK